MKGREDRARELLPAIVITVLSMIQALALELFWGKIRETDLAVLEGWNAAIHWLQLAVMFLGMLQIWLFYVSLVLRLSWLPTMEDTIIPFAIGLLEFSMIDMLGTDRLATWFFTLAALFAISMGASHVAFRRARQDPENADYFRDAAPSSWRDYLVSMVVVTLLALFGLVLWLTSNREAIALTAMLFALAAIAYQLSVSHRRW